MSPLDHPLLSARYFFPRAAAAPSLHEVPVEGAVLGCSAYLTAPARPLLVHFHGNGEVVADYAREFSRALSAVGIDSFFAEYRGYGASTGVPALGAMLGDVARVLEATGRSPERTWVYGRSVGSIYAVEATRVAPGLGGLIVESGIADVAERIRKRVTAAELGVTQAVLDAEVAQRLDHRAKVESFQGRTLVLHALNDATIDVSHARRLRKWARRGELELFDTGDHNSVFTLHFREIVERVARFIHGA